MRRLMGVIITGEAVAAVVREGFRRKQYVRSEIPESAKFYTAHFSHERNAFVAVFEDPSFAPVAEGGLIPLMNSVPEIREVTG